MAGAKVFHDVIDVCLKTFYLCVCDEEDVFHYVVEN